METLRKNNERKKESEKTQQRKKIDKNEKGELRLKCK